MSTDPVRAKRQRIARQAGRARGAGYLLFLAAVILFFIGFAAGFTDGLVTATLACLGVGSVLLAPAIVIGYAAKAAEREDRERGL